MNLRLLSWLLGIVCLLIGSSMTLSLPWAFPFCGMTDEFETWGFWGLFGAMLASFAVGAGLMAVGRKGRHERLLRKEAMAVVALSWILASLLGALPFLISGVVREVRVDPTTGEKVHVPMGLADALFESASGFTGTGASVLTDLDNPDMAPRCIIFLRSAMHLLGGLGIMVLFVAILGQGSAGKTLMRAEMAGPTKDVAHSRTQTAAWNFASMFLGLNVAAVIVLKLLGMNWYDALAHAFGAVATGGFSTHNASVGHFQSPAIEAALIFFMFLGCTNFTLMYWAVMGHPGRLFRDLEFRTYVGILVGVSLLVGGFGLLYGDFKTLWDAVRFSTFQVVSVQTNTGYGTHDFDQWNGFSRGCLLLLMYIGGCAGSTSCSLKVIRHMLFWKALLIEVETSFRPNVVRPMTMGGKPVDDPDLRKNVLVYFGLVLFISVTAWMVLLAVEPSNTWASDRQTHKLIDCAAGVATTINGVGPALGIAGPTQNFARFGSISKLVFVFLMLVGRLEVFSLLALFQPSFWRSQ